MTRKMDKKTTILILTVCALVHWISSSDAACAMKFKVIPGHTACLNTTVGKSQPPTEEDKEMILEKHNMLRAGVSPPADNMMKLTWDDELEMIAQKWADTCPGISHDKIQHRFVPGRFSVGQNMGSGHASFDEIIQAWYDESGDYTYGTSKSAHNNIRKTIGHYTQIVPYSESVWKGWLSPFDGVVWADSVKLGCGRSICDGRPTYVCDYAPAGNVDDFIAPYRSGKGPNCETSNNSLCDCGGKVCYNSMNINPKTCACDCDSNQLLPDCSLNCYGDDQSLCGRGDFVKENCTTNIAPFVTARCPKMCGICPYATKGYNGTSQRGASPGRNENRAPTCQLCFPLFILSILVAFLGAQ